MDDGEVELSDPKCSNSNSYDNTLQKSSVDSIIDEILKHTTTCTHTHTCNPPGPDAIHTHTCYHTHTQLVSDIQIHSDTPMSKPRRPFGNREAVRKYREKKKAHTAYLEEEVKKLRVLNQQLVRKVQRQAILEAEFLRLRSLLVDLRGKIDIELGLFPSNVGFKEGDEEVVGLQCLGAIPCYRSGGIVDCHVNCSGSECPVAEEALVCGKNEGE